MGLPIKKLAGQAISKPSKTRHESETEDNTLVHTVRSLCTVYIALFLTSSPHFVQV